METIIDIVKLVLYCIPFVASCCLTAKFNLKKEHRYKQVFLPIMAIIYGIIALIFMEDITYTILGVIYFLTDTFTFLSFLKDVNWVYWIVIVANTALAAGFAFVKAVLFPIVMGLAFIPKLSDATSGAFYFVSDEDKKEGKSDIRYLKSKFGAARSILNIMYYALLAVFVVLLVLTNLINNPDIFSAPFYPVFGILVLGEMVAFLSGKTYEEKQEEPDAPPPAPDHQEIDYDNLVEKYQELFPQRCSESYHEDASVHLSEATQALLAKYKAEYEDTLNQEAGLTYTFFTKRAEDGVILDEGYIRQTRNILDGKSVLFFTQFYNDTSEYIFLPALRMLMKRKRILIVLGNSASTDSMKKWFSDGLASINGFENIWKISSLADADDDSFIIILDTKNINNQKLLNKKASLIAECSMVFITEPSRLLGTLQIGLSTVVTYLRQGGNDPQYILYDRNCDGLVDSISHVLNKSIVQVNATVLGGAKKNVVFWKADGKLLHHKLGLSSSRYLGLGTELAIPALKEGVSKVVWAAAKKFPVIDMRWIASQYYTYLCKAANLTVSQNELAEHMEFTQDPWLLPKTEHSFIVAEDEFNNAFEIARQFTTRGEQQSFVNVISSHYWLREYMTSNMEIFRQDPKTIPAVTPDYQRTAANAVYKLIIRMIECPVEESEVYDVLDAIGEDVSNVYQSLRALILKYFFRVDAGTKDADRYSDKIDNAVSMVMKNTVNPKTMRAEKKRCYSINNQEFVNSFLSQLKIVYYVAEDEKNRDNFLDSAMYGHVYQKYLPGMMITIDGKSYEVISMTKNSGILVRRAADHINSRKYYRILRSYNVSSHAQGDISKSKYSINGITVENLERDIVANTHGYLEMREYSDIKNAKHVNLSNIEPREYRNKDCIRLRFEGSTPAVRVTIATLLNELFVTTFPDSYQYIVATTKVEDPESVKGYIPVLNGADDDSVYIIEDSLIDLGLLVNVERYLERFLAIICDALNWHQEKLAEEKSAGIESGGHIIPDASEDDEEEEKTKPKGFIGIIKGLFGRKKKKGKKSKDDSDQAESENDAAENRAIDPYRVQRSRLSAKGEVFRSQEPDDSGITGDDSEFISVNGGELEGADTDIPYSKSFFLLYGYDTVPAIFDLEGTEKYLGEQGFANNYLKQTRDGCKHRKLKWYNYYFEAGTHYCDFCGAPLEGTFDVLDDGRERCADCSAEAITKIKDFKKVYKTTRKQMEQIFGIKLKAKISIKMCNAQKIAEELNDTFVATPGFDSRTLGFTYRRGGTNDIFIENGAPRIETEKTLVHEMTHIWQYANLPDMFEGSYDLSDVEGMAVWAEAQYLTSLGMADRASDYIYSRLMQNNEYGNGLRKYLDKFPISNKGKATSNTPFTCKKNPMG